MLRKLLPGAAAVGAGAYGFSERRVKSDSGYQYGLTYKQKWGLSSSSYFEKKKPVVVAIYDEEGGVTRCNMMLNYFEEQGMNVVKVSPEEGLKHPIFQEEISGIYLPGGPDIESEGPRTMLEGRLIELAKKRDIPVMGVCRGMQAIGYHHGQPVKNLPRVQRDENDEYPHYDDPHGDYCSGQVAVGGDSQLFHALKKKIGGSEELYTFPTVCMHAQHVDAEDSQELPVVGVGQAGIVEAMERKTAPGGKYLIIGYQHHPEQVLQATKDKEAEEKEQRQGSGPGVRGHWDDYSLFESLEKDDSSIEEKAARAEIGLFTDQVTHKFFDQRRLELSKKDSFKPARPFKRAGSF